MGIIPATLGVLRSLLTLVHFLSAHSSHLQRPRLLQLWVWSPTKVLSWPALVYIVTVLAESGVFEAKCCTKVSTHTLSNGQRLLANELLYGLTLTGLLQLKKEMPPLFVKLLGGSTIDNTATWFEVRYTTGSRHDFFGSG